MNSFYQLRKYPDADRATNGRRTRAQFLTADKRKRFLTTATLVRKSADQAFVCESMTQASV